MANLLKTVENFLKALRDENPGLHITVDLHDIPKGIIEKQMAASQEKPKQVYDEATGEIVTRWSGYVDADKRIWASTEVDRLPANTKVQEV